MEDGTRAARPALFGELLDSTVAGCAYGATAAVLSHPLDTLKTRQQTVYFHATGGQSSHQPEGRTARTGVVGPWEALLHTWRQNGLLGLYAGLLPSFIGSVAFRSLPFIAYKFSSQQLKDKLPKFSERLPALSAFLAGASGGALRSVVECPLEVLKVRRQAGLRLELGLNPLFSGAALTFARNVSMIGLFWTFLELSKDARQSLFGHQPALNSFAAGGGCSVLAWACIYPLDLVKSQAQAPEAATACPSSTGAAHQGFPRRSALATSRAVLRTRGLGGFYQGLTAGLARTVVANGCSMVVYDWVCASLQTLH